MNVPVFLTFLVKNIQEHREMITSEKLDALFNTSIKLNRVKEEKHKKAEDIEQLRWQVEKQNEWREDQIQEGLDRENRHHHDLDYKRKQQLLNEREALVDETESLARANAHLPLCSHQPGNWPSKSKRPLKRSRPIWKMCFFKV